MRHGAVEERGRAAARTSTPTSSASPTTSSRQRPAVHRPRRPHPRERSWVVDKELDVALRRARRDRAAERLRRGRARRRARSLVPELPDDADELATWLSQRRARAASPRAARQRPQLPARRRARREGRAGRDRGAQRGARPVLYKTRRSADFTARSQALADLQDALGLDERRCASSATTCRTSRGTNIVASMVVFEDGLPRKDQYRRFNVPRPPTTPTRSTRC